MNKIVMRQSLLVGREGYTSEGSASDGGKKKRKGRRKREKEREKEKESIVKGKSLSGPLSWL